MEMPSSPPPDPGPIGEWKQLAAVALVAVTLGMFGLAISSRFDVVALPPTETTEPGPGASTTIPQLGTTTTVVDGVTTTAVGATPPTLTLSADPVDFGEESTSTVFEIANAGGSQAQWSVELDHLGLSASPNSGQLAPGEVVAVTLNLDRAIIEEGDFSSSLRLIWNGGETGGQIVAINMGNPIIGSPRASPPTVVVAGGGACAPTRSTVSARVKDQSALESVFVRWSPDGSSTVETPMDPVGDDVYETSIGPFSSAGTPSVRVLAFDELGNAGGAAVSMTVNPCP